MNKLLIIMIMLMAIMSCGCIDAKKIGRDAAMGALHAAEDFGQEFSEKKNAAELSAAVIKGEKYGISYDEIDTDGDGIYSGAEATSFTFRVGQLELGARVQPALDKLLSGDLVGAKIAAKAAGDDIWAIFKDYMLAIVSAGGSGMYLLRRHKRITKEEVHAERDGNRRLRGEPTSNTLGGSEAPVGIPSS